MFKKRNKPRMLFSGADKRILIRPTEEVVRALCDGEGRRPDADGACARYTRPDDLLGYLIDMDAENNRRKQQDVQIITVGGDYLQWLGGEDADVDTFERYCADELSELSDDECADRMRAYGLDDTITIYGIPVTATVLQGQIAVKVSLEARKELESYLNRLMGGRDFQAFAMPDLIRTSDYAECEDDLRSIAVTFFKDGMRANFSKYDVITYPDEQIGRTDNFMLPVAVREVHKTSVFTAGEIERQREYENGAQWLSGADEQMIGRYLACVEFNNEGTKWNGRTLKRAESLIVSKGMKMIQNEIVSMFSKDGGQSIYIPELFARPDDVNRLLSIATEVCD